jgi:hypothetical protein
MIVQVIGLPCIGKSSLIKKYKKIGTVKYEILDIRDFHSPKREEKLIKAMSANCKNYIIESACGIEIPSSIIILVKKSKFLHKKQIQKRGDIYENYELQSIEDEMIPADFTVYNENAFYEILNYYLE